jgi:hypothetical protein
MTESGRIRVTGSVASAEDPLGASVYLGGPDVEGVRDLEDVAEARIALAALNAAVVGSINPTTQSESLLRDTSLLPKLSYRAAKSRVVRRAGLHATILSNRGFIVHGI